jgi:hypothetical protein
MTEAPPEEGDEDRYVIDQYAVWRLRAWAWEAVILLFATRQVLGL